MPVVVLPSGMTANSIQSNPWNPTQYVVSAATNFGIAGGGGVFMIASVGGVAGAAAGNNNSAVLMSRVIVPGAGVLDSAISEVNESIVVSGCTDGSLVVSKMGGGGGEGVIMGRIMGNHRSDVASVAWNPSKSNLFATGSWDRGICVFDVERVGAALNNSNPAAAGAGRSAPPQNVASTQFGGPPPGMMAPPMMNQPNAPQPPLPPPSAVELQAGGHSAEIYEVSWCPKQPHLLASVGGDGALKIWDMRTAVSSSAGGAGFQNGNRPLPPHPGGGGASSNRPVISVEAAHGIGQQQGRRNKVMTVSWNNYEPFICATGGTDNSVKVWDLRKVGGPSAAPPPPLVYLHSGHQAPVRRVRFSPHHRTCLLSGGYDYRVCMWNLNGGSALPSGAGGASTTHLQYRHDHHKEFVTDVEWCMNPANPLDVASCSWDGTVALWKLGTALSM